MAIFKEIIESYDIISEGDLSTKYQGLASAASAASLKAKGSESKAHHMAAHRAHKKAHAAAIAVSDHHYDNDNSKRGERYETHAERHDLAAGDHHTQAEMGKKERGQNLSMGAFSMKR